MEYKQRSSPVVEGGFRVERTKQQEEYEAALEECSRKLLKVSKKLLVSMSWMQGRVWNRSSQLFLELRVSHWVLSLLEL